MSIPEILSNALSYVDTATLQQCLRVSCLWYTCGQHLAWRTVGINMPRFISRVCDPIGSGRMNAGEDSDSDNDIDEFSQKRQDFLKNCRHIQSLCLTDARFERWLELIDELFFIMNPNTPVSLNPQAACLKNLVHFSVHSTLFRPWSTPDRVNTPNLYYIVGAVVRQNPGIQNLEWKVDESFAEPAFVNIVLRRMTRNLKKLSIVWRLSGTRLEFVLQHVMKAYEKRLEQPAHQELMEEKLPQKRLTIAQGSLDDPSLTDEAERKSNRNDAQENDDGHGAFQLDELVLEDPHGPSEDRGSGSNLDLLWLESFEGVLPIRSLSLVNIETAFYRERGTPDSDSDSESSWNNESQDPDDSLLTILRKCPNLEKLRVTFDLYRRGIPSDAKFLDSLKDDTHFLHDFYLNNDYVINEGENFASSMHRSCPKLRELELGMFYQLEPEQWIRLMKYYRRQLESLSIWGNVIAFTSDAFMSLIGPPKSNPSKNRLHCLTRLNINGMSHLHDCAWMALFHLPLLKEFRAREVPLDARELTSEDSWTCKGLEVLEIFVLIPKRTQWQWRKNEDRWVKDVVCSQKGMTTNTTGSLNRHDDKKKCDSGRNHKNSSLKRPAMDSTTEEKPPKRVKTSSSQRRCERLAKSLENGINKHAQFKVCKMIGQLTQLRELRIEGEKNYRFSNKNWHCLELTLETGLDCLAPLRENLQKLIVTHLDDGLHFGAETEWIARNWVHYNNPQWLGRHASKALQPQVISLPQGREEPEEGRPTGAGFDGDTDLFTSSPKFKELIGITSVTSNIKWLKEHCPTLSVVWR
ncbi:hypothetical protein BGX34_011907 [Mortierella sp. NVP85]|nr:hypothetical protein BGX34_011907 [Mortierella sp. NVP85]